MDRPRIASLEKHLGAQTGPARTDYSKGSDMRIHAKLGCSTVNGPGKRAVIWVNGCDLACSGCWNENTWKIDYSKAESTESLIEWVLAQVKEHDIEGISLSGGEPLQQTEAVANFLTDLKAVWPHCSVGMFTGYSLKETEKWEEQRKERAAYWKVISNHLDFAVMGRFNKYLVQLDHPLLSSKNQELVLFSDWYTKADFERQLIEVLIEPDGTRTITGFPVSKWEYLLDRVD